VRVCLCNFLFVSLSQSVCVCVSLSLVTAYTIFYVSLELCAPNNKNVNIVLKLFVPLKNKSDHTKEFYGKMVTQIYIY